jgi:DNA-binding transcriptional LysR family regulator
MDRLKALEIFKAVADRGSFVKAAEALDLSTPAVSRSVQDLEKTLGVRLLQRTTRRVSLTPEGEQVLQRARGMLDAYDELAALSSEGAAQVAGEIRFKAPASFSSWLVPALAEFTARHPKARVQLVACDMPMDLVAERIDLDLRVTRVLPDSLIARRVGDVPIGVYAAPAYLARKGTPKHPHELAEHDCLVRGSGLALLPHFLAASAVSRGELQPVLTQWPSPPLGMFLAYTSRRNLHLRVRKLIDHLAVTLAGMIGGEHPVAQASLATRRPRMAESTAA